MNLNNLVNDLAICPKDLQDKTIALAEEADNEYGKRLKDGLTEKANQQSADLTVEFGEEMRPLGVHEARKTIKEIMDKARNSDSY